MAKGWEQQKKRTRKTHTLTQYTNNVIVSVERSLGIIPSKEFLRTSENLSATVRHASFKWGTFMKHVLYVDSLIVRDSRFTIEITGPPLLLPSIFLPLESKVDYKRNLDLDLMVKF